MKFADLLREIKSNVITRRIVAGSLIAAIVLDCVVVYILFYDYLMHFSKFTEGVLEKTVWVVLIYLLRLVIFSICYSSLLLNKCGALSFRAVVIFCRYFLSKISLVFLLLVFVVGGLFFLTIDIGVVFSPISVATFHALLVIAVLKLPCKKTLSWCWDNSVCSVLWLSYLLACVVSIWSFDIYNIVLLRGVVSYGSFYYTVSSIIEMYLDVLNVSVCCMVAIVAEKHGYCSDIKSLLGENGKI